MELNRKVLVKVAVMLFLLGTTATVEARFDARSFIKEVLPNADAANYFVKSTTTGFICACTLPPLFYTCVCPGEACFAACTGICSCAINEVAGTRNCKCIADETKLSPGAGAH